MPDLPELDAIDTVGVVGAGNMGNGIAQVAAMAGYDVVMRDIEQEYVENGLESIEYSLDRLVSREAIDETTAERVIEAGDLGKKTGKGSYEYE